MDKISKSEIWRQNAQIPLTHSSKKKKVKNFTLLWKTNDIVEKKT